MPGHFRSIIVSIMACAAALSCHSPRETTADAIKSYRSDAAQSSGKLTNGQTQDLWESPLQIMISRDRALTNDEIRELCQTPTRLSLVPLGNGQTISPETDFKVYKEGRTCYERQITGSCNGWNYHGTFTCFYYLNKGAQ